MKMNIVLGSFVLGASLCGQSFGGDLLSRLLGGHGCGASSSCCDTSVADPSCGAEMAPCGSGCAADPSCGAEMAAPCGTGIGAGAGPSCGAEIAACDPCGTPSCGVESPCRAPRKPLLSALKGLKGKLCGIKSKLACAPSCGSEIAACDPCAAPSCGAEMAPCGSGFGAGPSCGAEIAACDPCGTPSCDSGCGLKKRGLLAKIFSCKKSSCCDTVVACDSCAAPAGCSSCGTSVAAPVAAPAAAPAPVVDPHAYMNTKRHVIQASITRIR